jgi:hypothetical protein
MLSKNHYPVYPDIHSAYGRIDSMRRRELVQALRSALGNRLTAYILGASDTKTVREWAQGARDLDRERAERAAIALYTVAILSRSENASIIQSWFQGMNPALGDCAPARYLAENKNRDSYLRVLQIAYADSFR